MSSFISSGLIHLLAGTTTIRFEVLRTVANPTDKVCLFAQIVRLLS